MAVMAAVFAISACIGTAVPTEAVEITFSTKEKSIIASFYGGDGGNPGKGKDKKNKGKGVGNQGMPPGLAKKGKLPPGIAKRQLPSALVAQLPPPPKGYERVIVDNDILLVNIATQIVHDVLTDALR
jgi:hypothetical protein